MNIPQPDDFNQDMPVLEFKDVTFHWPGGKGLSEVSFAVPAGQFVLISGSSGAGKSTLLRLAVRLEEIQQGEILLQGQPLDSFYPPALRTRIGFVQQMPVILPGSVRDNLLMPFTLQSRTDSTIPSDEILTGWMERLALTDVALDDEAGDLSVGQRQRLCLIRSVLPRPVVICFDEPTSSLDRESRERVERIAEELAAEGIAVLMVNHTSYHPDCPHMHLTVADGKVEEE
ncbi:ABC transporter ATP-binding protein [Maridesulfovibrio hydrothermalis]|uniref:ABC transporter related n=1 Tax=Maridesulfovibrio hydrothermalis AM13 = DSM 14728 TaxID=1121451 RepID=L0RH23_9BACT|nr:ABC transporter ATP-binding protein [Maridesulfovibrio hydrothermalis]CCO25505.1 ABC transporter related [Maridesulfovibrio hydrothermalis AM13 = DSM 14728]